MDKNGKEAQWERFSPGSILSPKGFWHILTWGNKMKQLFIFLNTSKTNFVIIKTYFYDFDYKTSQIFLVKDNFFML